MISKFSYSVFSTANNLSLYHWQVYNKLKQMEGVDVYLTDEIPEKFHYKSSKYIYDIVINAKPGKSFSHILLYSFLLDSYTVIIGNFFK